MRRYETPRQTSERIKICERTLEQYRTDGGGPPFIKLGRKVLYDIDQVDAWLAAFTVASTSEATVREAAQ